MSEAIERAESTMGEMTAFYLLKHLSEELQNNSKIFPQDIGISLADIVDILFKAEYLQSPADLFAIMSNYPAHQWMVKLLHTCAEQALLSLANLKYGEPNLQGLSGGKTVELSKIKERLEEEEKERIEILTSIENSWSKIMLFRGLDAPSHSRLAGAIVNLLWEEIRKGPQAATDLKQLNRFFLRLSDDKVLSKLAIQGDELATFLMTSLFESIDQKPLPQALHDISQIWMESALNLDKLPSDVWLFSLGLRYQVLFVA